jgi:hypothetical protein
VYSSALKWYPITKRQKKKYEANPPAPALDDIIIAKLRPGQVSISYHTDPTICNRFYKLIRSNKRDANCQLTGN